MLKLFERCPACGGPIVITECRCKACQLVMRGEFQPGQFSVLTDDQLTFTRQFLRVRGNLTELEKVLGVSYPSIRNKLDEINLALDRSETAASSGPAPAEAATAPADPAEQLRQAILKQVAAGELSAADGVLRLRALQGGKS
ncbi:MAG TPA: DUF2089 family protein [Anaerolineaceae bacterium]